MLVRRADALAQLPQPSPAPHVSPAHAQGRSRALPRSPSLQPAVPSRPHGRTSAQRPCQLHNHLLHFLPLGTRPRRRDLGNRPFSTSLQTPAHLIDPPTNRLALLSHMHTRSLVALPRSSTSSCARARCTSSSTQSHSPSSTPCRAVLSSSLSVLRNSSWRGPANGARRGQLCPRRGHLGARHVQLCPRRGCVCPRRVADVVCHLCNTVSAFAWPACSRLAHDSLARPRRSPRARRHRRLPKQRFTVGFVIAAQQGLRRSRRRRGELRLPRYTLRLPHAQVAKPSSKPRRRSPALVVVLVPRTYPHPRVHSVPSGFR
jgi:hypothetical protein